MRTQPSPRCALASHWRLRLGPHCTPQITVSLESPLSVPACTLAIPAASPVLYVSNPHITSANTTLSSPSTPSGTSSRCTGAINAHSSTLLPPRGVLQSSMPQYGRLHPLRNSPPPYGTVNAPSGTLSTPHSVLCPSRHTVAPSAPLPAVRIANKHGRALSAPRRPMDSSTRPATGSQPLPSAEPHGRAIHIAALRSYQREQQRRPAHARHVPSTSTHTAAPRTRTLTPSHNVPDGPLYAPVFCAGVYIRHHRSP